MKIIGLKTVFAGLLVAATATGALAQQVTGAGATFPAPLYAKWAEAYNKATGIARQLPVRRAPAPASGRSAARPSTSVRPTCR